MVMCYGIKVSKCILKENCIKLHYSNVDTLGRVIIHITIDRTHYWQELERSENGVARR